MAVFRNSLIIGLVLACAGVVFGGGAGESASERAGFVNHEFLISAEELTEAQGGRNLLILDARKADDYAIGHIPGAVSLPTSEIEETVNVGGAEARFIVKSAEEVAPILQDAGISRNTRIVIYDDGGSTRATRLWWVLDYYGHKKAAVLNGGLGAWTALGRTVTTEVTNAEPGRFEPVPDETKIASYEYVKANLHSASTAVCDALSAQSYQKGAIESAISLPAAGFYADGETPLLRSAAELADVMQMQGLSKDGEVIFYCGAGYAASVNYFVARTMGFTNVRLYDGSKSDWVARGEELVPAGQS